MFPYFLEFILLLQLVSYCECSFNLNQTASKTDQEIDEYDAEVADIMQNESFVSETFIFEESHKPKNNDTNPERKLKDTKMTDYYTKKRRIIETRKNKYSGKTQDNVNRPGVSECSKIILREATRLRYKKKTSQKKFLNSETHLPKASGKESNHSKRKKCLVNLFNELSVDN